MKIIIEDEFGRYEIEDKREHLDIHEMMDLVERALIATSYSPETVKNGFYGKIEEYETK